MKPKTNTEIIIKPVDRYVFFAISFIWLLIAFFAIISVIQPEWLIEISNPGRRVESNTSLENGNELMYAGNFKDAIGFYNTALAIDSTNLEALGNLGIALMYAGDYKAAETIFYQLGKSLKDDYRIVTCYINMAELYDRMKQPQKAFDYYLKDVETGNGTIYTYRKAGYLAFKLGNDSLAIELLLKSAEMTRSLEYYYDEALFIGFQSANHENDTANIQVFSKMLEKVGETESMTRFDNEVLQLWLQTSKDLGYAYLYLTEIMLSHNNMQRARDYAALCRRYLPELNDKLHALNSNL